MVDQDTIERPAAVRKVVDPLRAPSVGVRVRPKPRYYTELMRPDPKFLSEWRSANIVLDSAKHDADSVPYQVAICSSYKEAQLIVDALNYGAVVG